MKRPEPAIRDSLGNATRKSGGAVMSGKHQRLHARDDAGRKLHCKRGHDMTDSYVWANGSRVCRWCKRIMDRKHFYLVERLRGKPALPTTYSVRSFANRAMEIGGPGGAANTSPDPKHQRPLEGNANV